MVEGQVSVKRRNTHNRQRSVDTATIGTTPGTETEDRLPHKHNMQFMELTRLQLSSTHSQGSFLQHFCDVPLHGQEYRTKSSKTHAINTIHQ